MKLSNLFGKKDGERSAENKTAEDPKRFSGLMKQPPKDEDQKNTAGKEAAQSGKTALQDCGVVFKPDESSVGRADRLYKDLVYTAKYIIGGAVAETPVLNELLFGIIDELAANNDELLVLASKTTREDYRPSHLANTAIYSLKMGIAAGLEGERLIQLGTEALYHKHAPKKPALPPKVCPPEGSAQAQNENLIEVNIEEIVDLAGRFEDGTHMRPDRHRSTAFDVLKSFIEGSKTVSAKRAVKWLIESVSAYPVGSLVELNNGEIGEVHRINKNFSTRPVIKVFLDKEGAVVKDPEYVDLVQYPMIHIKRALSDTFFESYDKYTQMKVKLRRWWME